MEKEQQYKKVLITVNDKPIGKEIWIDKVTYRAVSSHEMSVIGRSNTEASAG
ncbi:hypothetical protein [Paenibacillus azoreducens]|uniref:Uncharacterized protein n=1 Tax=Paenibacillus azoreducens TaxID=116718 RepID=A0A919YCJ8_9BACL|nr:hypothetical protein [Paenibacillus azoreducens]GIO46535.1 hypothetical protein J34TS1_13000 [Paenibacillus azoreducens]